MTKTTIATGNIAGIAYREGMFYYSPLTNKTYRCVKAWSNHYEGSDRAYRAEMAEDDSCTVEAIFIDGEEKNGLRVGDDGIIYMVGDGNLPVIDKLTMQPMNAESTRVEIRNVEICPVCINIAE